MLVCNVSLRPPRVGIAADIAETAAAVDATATGNVVFATLVDDPASVLDRVDAYLGEIMLEAASAAAAVNAELTYAAAIVEAVNAADTISGVVPTVVTAAVAETVTAADVPDATVIAALPARDAMLPNVFVNSDGTSREANIGGVMVNL
jgi:hypothetical protein